MSTVTRTFVWIPEPVEGFDDDQLITDLQAWVDENEAGFTFTDDLLDEVVEPSVIVRAPRGTEARGLYERHENGNLQILRYSIAAPERVRELTDAAFNAVCCG